MSLSFRAKLQIAFIGVSLVLVGGALFAARDAAMRAAQQNIERTFARTAAQLENLVKTRLSSFEDIASAAVSDPLFRSQIQRTVQSDSALGLGDEGDGLGGGAEGGDDNPVAEAHGIFQSAELPLFQRYPVLAIVNAEGELLFSKGEPTRFGGAVKDVPLVGKGASQRGSVALWSGADATLRAQGLIPENAANETYLVMGRQIAHQDGVLGVVLAGESLTQGLLAELERLSDAEVLLTGTDGVAVASDPQRKGELGEMSKGLALGKLSELTRRGEHVLGTHATIPGLEPGSTIGDAYLFRSLEREIGPFNRQLASALWLVSLIAIAVAVLVATLFALGMTRPLKALDAAVKRVRTGDLTVKVPVTSKDEIGNLAQSFNEMTDGLRQRDQIKATFKRYLAPAVVEELLQNPDKLNLGGENRELTILFSDLVGFTSLSEGRQASELVALLNEYFDEVGQAIVRRGGTLDKFAGDSVMCFFGAPIAQDDHRARALLSALDHLRVVDSIQQRWQALGRPIIDCRIGLNSGPVVVGNIGSRDGQDYTVIGDAVNLASRLEGANKEYGSRLMASEDSLKGCESLVVTRELDSIRVKGKAIPVRVFEVLGEPGEVPRVTLEAMEIFHEGLTLYRNKQFPSAKAAFDRCLAIRPTDGPSRTFSARCDHFIAEPPDGDWDGVWKMTSK